MRFYRNMLRLVRNGKINQKPKRKALPMPEKFSLLGVDGLLLPGTVERPCPWSVDTDEWNTSVIEAFAYKGLGFSLAKDDARFLSQKSATASCWWRSRFDDMKTNGAAEDEACEQMHLWQTVFERACERMKT